MRWSPCAPFFQRDIGRIEHPLLLGLVLAQQQAEVLVCRSVALQLLPHADRGLLHALAGKARGDVAAVEPQGAQQFVFEQCLVMLPLLLRECGLGQLAVRRAGRIGHPGCKLFWRSLLAFMGRRVRCTKRAAVERIARRTAECGCIGLRWWCDCRGRGSQAGGR